METWELKRLFHFHNSLFIISFISMVSIVLSVGPTSAPFLSAFLVEKDGV